MTRNYDQYRPTFGHREMWSAPAVLAERARTHGDKTYLDVGWTGERFTYAESLDIAQRVGRGLLAGGASPGDRLLIMAPNSAAYIWSWLGSAMAGMAEVPINTAYRGSFLEHQTATVSPSAAVIHADYADRFAELPEAVSTIGCFYLLGDAGEIAKGGRVLDEAGLRWQPWDTLPADNNADITLPEVSYRDLGSVFFTSGTTGLSKGVMMPHAHMHLFADECVSLTRLTDADAYMSCGPLFHGNSHFLAAYPALIAGARYVLQERFSASQWLEQVQESGATVTNFVGVMMDFVWQQPSTEGDADNKLRCVFAAPTMSSVLEEFKARFGIEAFVEVFGLTETCMPILTPYGEDRPAGAAGLLNHDWFDIRLVDPDTDEEVPVGEVGELVVRSRVPWTTCMGYYGMAEQTWEAFRNLWFHTGDGLRQDADGWYYFVDRLKDAIRRRGENISSFEVEQALMGHEAIAEVAVVAVPADQEAGEDEVLAAVVLEPDAALGADEFWAYADRRLPYFAVPRYVRFTPELPKTPSEKVRKIELREQGVDDQTFDRGPISRPKDRR